jgi:hypothetical protein
VRSGGQRLRTTDYGRQTTSREGLRECEIAGVREGRGVGGHRAESGDYRLPTTDDRLHCGNARLRECVRAGTQSKEKREIEGMRDCGNARLREGGSA